MNKNEKIKQIINLIYDSKKVTIEELAYLLNVSTSTIKRYKKIINESTDVTICSVAGRNGGYYIRLKCNTLKEQLNL